MGAGPWGAHRADRPAPVWGFMGPRSPALPEFDPFWSKVAEATFLVGMHASDSGYQRYYNEWEGVADGEMTPFRAARDSRPSSATRGGPHRHHCLADRPRPVLAVPDVEVHAGRERVQLGPAASPRYGVRLPVRTQRLRREPGRRLQPEYLRASPSTRRIPRVSSTSSVPTRALPSTIRTPRAWPTPSPSWTTCRDCQRTPSRRSWAAT